MSLCQVTQVLQYRDWEALAEHAIATVFDGIPSAYVRRQNLGVIGLQRTEDPVGSIDYAVLFYPVGPSTPRSLEQLACTPVSAATQPSSVRKGAREVAWVRPPTEELPSTLRNLARLAEVSLASVSRPLPSCTGDSIEGTPVLTADAGDPPMTMGLIYDSECIRLVAHIPYAVADGYNYLSLLFDTLPFPSRCAGSAGASEFVRGRYRVALALLAVQQHIFRMVTRMERVEWPESHREAQRSAMRDLLVDRFAEVDVESDRPTSTETSDWGLYDRITTEQNSDTFQAHEGRIKQSNPVVKAWILQRDIGRSSASDNVDGFEAPLPEDSQSPLKGSAYTSLTTIGLEL
ncbi:uncharacterized protein B0H18DRAFT_1115271 [Fomitopsis serialis]|uniref:uncharacterized protein n=1 Tax=Fomitopsis serialis TaxID=139415 RepID=UPI002007AFA6|nr:uncharacterized protein B0H18DRAFT_1115271 [Neoantrodia serialis]KAH9933917.1 hypothetical protein B0H18DRAFT_1115271 [Neoantrodia serialis]